MQCLFPSPRWRSPGRHPGGVRWGRGGSRGRGTHGPAEEGGGRGARTGGAVVQGDPACEPGGAAGRSPPAPGGRGCRSAEGGDAGEAAARASGLLRGLGSATHPVCAAGSLEDGDRLPLGDGWA